MSFLKEIDKIHSKNMEEYGISDSNTRFSSFIPVEPVGISLITKFVIKKAQKSKLLILSGNQRVYLSDYDIVSTIINMDKSYVNWFLSEFVKLYNGVYESYEFIINDDKIKGKGMNYYSKPYRFTLFSDTEIDINDFIFVLNFVFFKDKQWGQDSAQEDFRKLTLMKYIVLIDHYINKTKYSETFLSTIGYPVNGPLLMGKFEECIGKIEINLFDITKYM